MFTMTRSFVLFALATLVAIEKANAFVAAPLCQRDALTPSFATPEPSKEEAEVVKPDILQPYLPAADPMFAVRFPVGDKEFVLDRHGGPTAEELSNENIVKIVKIECSDLEVSARFSSKRWP
jgi:hypothetical protein